MFRRDKTSLSGRLHRYTYGVFKHRPREGLMALLHQATSWCKVRWKIQMHRRSTPEPTPKDSMPFPWYTDNEIDDLCAGLINSASKIRYLRALGLHVERKPNGRPLVMREHAEAVLSGRVHDPAPIEQHKVSPAPKTDREGFLQWAAARQRNRKHRPSA